MWSDVLVNISEDDRKLCDDFASQVFSTNQDRYARLGQANPELVKRQIADGKAAEFAAYQALRELGFQLDATPCLKIFESPKQKSFDCDLQGSGLRIHVKSQTNENAQRFRESYVFSTVDPLLSNPSPNDVVVCILQYSPTQFALRGIIPSTTVIPALKDPVLRKFKGLKKILYIEDVYDKRGTF